MGYGERVMVKADVRSSFMLLIGKLKSLFPKKIKCKKTLGLYKIIDSADDIDALGCLLKYS